jgi:hypothetical protein
MVETIKVDIKSKGRAATCGLNQVPLLLLWVSVSNLS